jgi:hypothetical protein
VRGCACRGTAGFAHVSCLAEQAKILVAEAEENNLGINAKQARWNRWERCSLCEQKYHGVVACALGWACWKTYLGRPETDLFRSGAMTILGSGLHEAGHHEDALSVQEAELSMRRRLGQSEGVILALQGNIATTYKDLGRPEFLPLRQRVHSAAARRRASLPGRARGRSRPGAGTRTCGGRADACETGPAPASRHVRRGPAAGACFWQRQSFASCSRGRPRTCLPVVSTPAV